VCPLKKVLRNVCRQTHLRPIDTYTLLTTTRCDSPIRHVESFAGIICAYVGRKCNRKDSPPCIGREKARSTLRCICARAIRIILSLRAILIHRTRQGPIGITYESTAWKHVTKLLVNARQTYSVPLQFSLIY